jgi:hypothetical protein
MTRRIARAILAILMLPALISVAPAQACHYEATISADITNSAGYVFRNVPIGRIVVEQCASPADLADKARALEREVRARWAAQQP